MKDGYGQGKFRFILGHGSSGTAGHVELSLQTTPEAGSCSIRWQVVSDMHAQEARERVEVAVGAYLRKYIARHPKSGFLITITEVTTDFERQNDYERAAELALRFALEEAGLPVPQIYAP